MQLFHKLLIFPVSWMTKPTAIAASRGRAGWRATHPASSTMGVWPAVVLQAVLELKTLFDLGKLCVHSELGQVVFVEGGVIAMLEAVVVVVSVVVVWVVSVEFGF